MNAGLDHPTAESKHLRQLDAARLSSRRVLDLLRGHLRFGSVLDVGCGTGALLSAVIEGGAEDVLGIDGAWADPQLLAFDPGLFRQIELNEAFDLGRRFDLVVSLETGEHVRPVAAAGFVASIARHGDQILFSAALPGQGGADHVNECWPESWTQLFAAEGFDAFDPIRRTLWGDADVEPWMQQNALLFLRRDQPVPKSLEPFRITGEPATFVHRVTYTRLIRRISQLKKEVADRQQAAGAAPRAEAPGSSGLPRQANAAEVTDTLVRNLRAGTPSSLVRLSHCESKFINWPDVFTREEINKSLRRQFGYVDIENRDIDAIAAMMRAAVACSDIVGVPVLTKDERARMEAGDNNLRLWNEVAPACQRHRLLHADTTITSPNIHLRLQDSNFLEHMAAVAPALTLIGCRDLRPQFRRLGFADVEHIPVPEAYRTRPRDLPVTRHYPDAFDAIVARIREARRGGLYFVGAGVLGKVYCQEARLAGGIAVDVGSVMDVWAGVVSRTGFEGRVQLYALEAR
ncbi:class I SAM-dependent methyltransferase [Roseomonas sp. WA12]